MEVKGAGKGFKVREQCKMCILGGALWWPSAEGGGQGVADLVRMLKQWPFRPACSKAVVTGVESRKH